MIVTRERLAAALRLWARESNYPVLAHRGMWMRAADTILAILHADPTAPCKHLWTAATSYQIAPGIPGSVCGKCGASPAFEELRRAIHGPTQPACPCCEVHIFGACAAVGESGRTGSCRTERCRCYGSVADGGLCEDCYVASK